MRIDEKIEQYLKEQASETVELLDDDGIGLSQSKISRAWPHGITYDGQPIFEAYMNIVDKIEANLKKQYNFEGQECYLGYNPNNESFITASEGFMDGDEEGISVISFMNFDNGSFKVFRTEQRDSFFYGSGYSPYKYIHREYPGTLDLRLD